MKASIIIPTCGMAPELSAVLDSLLVAGVQSRDAEIIVVDNNYKSHWSSDVAAICRGAGGAVRCVVEPSPGQTAARHRGAKEARGDCLLFIDDDVLVSREWLAAVLREFSDPTVGIVGGPSIPRFTGTVPAWFWTFIEPASFAGWQCPWVSLLDIGKPIREYDPNCVWGLNLCVRRELFMRVGGCHPDLVPPILERWQGDGEGGFTGKAKAAGARATYSEAAMVYHVIPPERLTQQYFAKRARYQAICDSFTHIRAGNDPDVAQAGPSPQVRWSAAPPAIRNAVATAYAEGWQYHQREAAEDPRLLKWIRRENFLDADIREELDHVRDKLVPQRRTHVSAATFSAWSNAMYAARPGEVYELTIDHARHPLACRAQSSDPDVFSQIFIRREYACLDHLTNVDLIIDCGANVGYSSAYFLSRFPGCRLIAVEPDPANFAMLARNLEPYGHAAKALQTGIWSHPAPLVLVDDNYRGGGAWAKQVRQCEGAETPDFHAVDIGSLLRDSGADRISILKIDIEGSEGVVFSKNYEDWIDRVDSIVIELHDDSQFGNCSAIFAKAIEGRGFSISYSGELTVCIKPQA